MFGRRPDATLVRGLSTMRAFMPFISPRRNESLVYYTQEIDPEPALRFIAEHNEAPKPFRWKKDPDKIIAAVKRGHQALDSIH